MLLYLDTEFTQLDWTAKLISIAVVDENEELFYVELDNYSLSDCSGFVKENVLPYLKGGECKMGDIEATARLSLWIEERGVPCKFATDAPHWDMRLLTPLLEDAWPSNLSKDVAVVDIPYKVQNDLYWNLKLTRHFAPHDALVNKLGSALKG